MAKTKNMLFEKMKIPFDKVKKSYLCGTTKNGYKWNKILLIFGKRDEENTYIVEDSVTIFFYLNEQILPSDVLIIKRIISFDIVKYQKNNKVHKNLKFQVEMTLERLENQNKDNSVYDEYNQGVQEDYNYMIENDEDYNF